MASRTSSLHKYPTLVIFIITQLFFFYGSNYAAVREASLQQFVQGVPLYEQARFKVKDILIGQLSVEHLFKPIDQKELTDTEYYWFQYEYIDLVLKRPEDLEELRVKLSGEPSGARVLKVVLSDDRDTFLKAIFSPELFKKTIEITIDLPPISACDEVTIVAYRKINSVLQQQLEKKGGTDKKITLDDIFNLLLQDEIEPYIDRMDPVQREDPCFKTFQLLKWLRGENTPGFAFREYRITGELKLLLEPITKSLTEAFSDSEKYSSTVRIIGYTDPVPVGENGIIILKNETGVEDWNNIEDPLEIYYAGCSENTLSGKEPYYIDYLKTYGKKIEKIRNNCELGAARAYVIMIYMMKRFGSENVKYEYATGGIDSEINTGSSQKADSKKRRVGIEFLIKTAKSD